jgi:translation elongation factor EF-1alpha
MWYAEYAFVALVKPLDFLKACKSTLAGHFFWQLEAVEKHQIAQTTEEDYSERTRNSEVV